MSSNILLNDTMTAKERIDRISYLKDTDRVGYAPQIAEHVIKIGNLTYYDYYYNPKKTAKAFVKSYQLYGPRDFSGEVFITAYLLPLYPDTHSRFFFNWIMPDKNNTNIFPQCVESERFSDYDELMNNGLMMFHNINKRLWKDLPLIAKLSEFNNELKVIQSKPYYKNTYPYSSSIIIHPTDSLSILRSLPKYLLDIRKQPDKLKEACDLFAPGFTEIGLALAKLLQSKKSKQRGEKPFILYGASRIGSTWISPKQFLELFYDSFKKQIRAIIKAGFRPMLHLDNSYTEMLEYFREIIPKGSGAIFHMDTTDIYKAKEILGDHMALMGNLNPALMTIGSSLDVEKKCKELIENIGAGGGYILANACNLPIDTKPENIIAMKKSIEKYGYYKR